jgi:predicted KAP-like P-loop ATPase
MWADNETTKDLLNYDVHCNLLKEYLSDVNILPLTIGVFGDWGSGKSSIMRMLEDKFQNDDRILTIYFNSWLFEGYEDAKISILENIILELSKHKGLSPQAKGKILGLLSRIDYMKIVSEGVKKYGKNIIDIIATGGVGTAIEAGFSMLNKEKIEEISKEGFSDFDKFIKEEQKNTSKTTIKSFKEDFAELISLTDFDSVVIFIDDLDRCMPERVVDTLEAIKLFLSVDKTAFVIGADERILKHSISMHLQLHTFNNDSSYLYDSEQIVTDYIEKLIQVPYHIPKMSPTEIESYINLLFCSIKLENEEFEKIYEKYLEFRKSDFYTAFSLGHIKDIVSLSQKDDLSRMLQISHQMSLMITNVLKGNPRQIKRFLNTFVLRKKLAQVANLNIDDFILIKLMLLEYFDAKLFKKINDSQAENEGIAKELQLLESVFIDGKKLKESQEIVKEWEREQIQNWIKIEPRIGEEDLRDYFWLTRDKTGSTLSDVHMVNPIIQKYYIQLLEGNEHLAKTTISSIKKEFGEDEKKEIVNLLKRDVNNNPSKVENALESFYAFIEEIKSSYFYEEFIETIEKVSFPLIKDNISLATKIDNISKMETTLNDKCMELLNKFAQQKGKLAQRSKQILEKK